MKKRKEKNFLLTDNQMAEFVSKGYLIFENGFDQNQISKIKEIGHIVVNKNEDNYMKGAFGGYQAIMKKDGVLYGASESRKDGHASGY